VLAGNKVDLVNEKVVSTEQAKTFAENNKMGFIETSAKEAINVERVFHQLARQIKDKIDQ